MRKFALMCLLVLIGTASRSFGQPASGISQLPDGVLNGGGWYVNQTLGLQFRTPSNWIVTTDPKGPVELDMQDANSRVNQCSKVLVSLKAPRTANGMTASDLLVAMDPHCFPDALFPSSIKDRDSITGFADKATHIFLDTGFVLPKGADIKADQQQWGPVIYLFGENVVSANNKNVHVNSLITITEYNGFWIAEFSLTDDKSKKDLAKNSRLDMRVP